jgi:hypothetical protein
MIDDVGGVDVMMNWLTTTTTTKSSVATLTSDQCKREIGKAHDLQYVSIAVCAVSCLSSLFVFIGYLMYKRETQKSPRMRLLLYMNIFGFIYSACLGIEAILLSLPRRVAYDYPFCQIQAFISNSSSLALNCWSLAFTLHLYFSVVVAGNSTFTKLQLLYKRIEHIFLFISVVIIPLPFFIMIFPMPIIGTDRYVLLYGHSDKQWCDFSNVEKKSNTIQWLYNYNNNNNNNTLVENYWALYWELGFFYIPNAVLFLVSVILYIRIIFKIRQNSSQLEKGKQLQQEQSEQLLKRKKSVIHTANIGSNSGSSGSSRSLVGNNVGVSSDIMDKPPISSATPIEYYDHSPASLSSPLSNVAAAINGSNPVTTPIAASSEYMFSGNQLVLQPFHFRLSRITLNDIEEYAKFLQSQTRTASYYIAAFMLNWIISIIARMMWEFGSCSFDDRSSRFMFICILIVMECTGPRIECILLSVIYGIAENTIQPNTLKEVMTDLVTLRYFKEFCSGYNTHHQHTANNNDSYHNSGRGYDDDDEDEDGKRRGSWWLWCFRSGGTKEEEEQSHLQPRHRYDSQEALSEEIFSSRNSIGNNIITIGSSNTGTGAVGVNGNRRSYDDLLFFWFDVQKMREVTKKRKNAIQELQQALKQQPQNNDQILLLKSQIEFYTRKIYIYAREICSLYLSESAPFSIHRWSVFTNIQRNRIRTLVLQQQNESESERDEEDDEDDDDDDSDTSSSEEGYSSESMSSSPPTHSSLSTTKLASSNDNNNKHSILLQYSKEEKLLQLLAEPQQKAYTKLANIMHSFRESTLYQELTHVLRMKAVSKSRSLYRDIASRLIVSVYSVTKRSYRLIKYCFHICCCGFFNAMNESNTTGEAYSQFYDDDYPPEYDELTRRHVMESSDDNIKIEDAEVYIYIKEQKRLKMKHCRANTFFQ